MTSAAPILVTGAHRSGTTWVGRMIATAPSVAYVHEPFSVHHDENDGPPRVEHWFTYICDENGSRYEASVRALLAVARGDGSHETPRRPLIKDPLAVFSAPWFARRFGTRNVVVIRHPAAFAGSLKARNWPHRFADFLAQPLLMAHHLEPFARDLMRFSRQPQDILDQAALLWVLVHAVVLEYQRAFPEWIYVRHEDLSRAPQQEFQRLLARLDLEWSDEIAAAVAAHSRAPAVPSTNDTYSITRDSLANIDTWKTRLTTEEVDRVRSRVCDVSRHFYSDDEW